MGVGGREKSLNGKIDINMYTLLYKNRYGSTVLAWHNSVKWSYNEILCGKSPESENLVYE